MSENPVRITGGWSGNSATITLALFTHGHWTELFRKIRGRDVLLMFLFMLLRVVVTLGVGFVMTKPIETTRNAAVSSLAGQNLADVVLFYVRAVLCAFCSTAAR